jgi:SAM-dependent methyltransferase
MENDAIQGLNRFVFEPSACPICDSQDAHARHKIKKYDQGELTFVTCRSCGTAYQNPRPNQESLHGFYTSENCFTASGEGKKFVGWLDYDAEEPTRQKNAAYRLVETEALFPAGQKLKILKIACGYGTFIKHARDAGHDATGIDFSKVMVAATKDRYDVTLVHANFMEHDFGDERYDVVLFYGAINNFQKPVEVGRKVLEILNPGGYYLTNFVEQDSIIERVQGAGFWLYRPPVVGLWKAAPFADAHTALGFKLIGIRQDIQWAPIKKLIGYLQVKVIIRIVRLLRMEDVFLKIPTPGYKKIILRKPTA